ncbi:MAG: nucleotidyltransferase domain-containing protein [Cetobacterium sp.]
MINLKKIEEAKKRLIQEFHPKKIYIFGSYAWGTPNEDSDLDIMVILDKCDDKILEMKKGLRALRGIGFSKDLIVEGEMEFLNNAKQNHLIENEILDKGYLLYEAN